MDERDLVLLVEDDEATAGFLADNLAADGYQVAVAGGVGEGLRAIEVRRPGLLVLDLMLDDGNGLELLDRVRSADGLATRIDPQLPVIVLTGRTGDSDRVRAFGRGADDYVAKPTAQLSSATESGSRCSTGKITSPSKPCGAALLIACGRTCGSTYRPPWPGSSSSGCQ